MNLTLGEGSTARQFARFVTVGVTSNLFLYLLYIVLTQLGLSYRAAASVAYILGTMQSFVFNRAWSFGVRTLHRVRFVRYAIAYTVAYVANLLLLTAFVDIGGFDHRAVQAVLIVVFSIILFVVQKLWIFRVEGHSK